MERLSGVLTSFGIDGHVTGAVQGPAVTGTRWPWAGYG